MGRIKKSFGNTIECRIKKKIIGADHMNTFVYIVYKSGCYDQIEENCWENLSEEEREYYTKHSEFDTILNYYSEVCIRQHELSKLI